MTFKGLLLFIFIFSFQFIFSQDEDLSILSIPDNLTKNANSVIRFDETNVELLSQRKMLIKVRKAITILNKRGDENSQLVVPYDKSNQIKKLKAYAYNSFGVEEKKISKKDFGDFSADGSSLFVDNRLKHYKYTPKAYPYTFYYEYELESSNTAFIPRWFPFDSYNQSIQNSTFHLIYPNDLKIQKEEKNFENFKVKKVTTNNKLTFILSNSLAIKNEQLCPSYIDIMPNAILATNKFRLEGVDGVANDWNEFGKWMYTNLISSRMELPETTKIKVKQLVKDVSDPIEKAKIIYAYVQNKTRYISVQVGIGGWMPMLAKDVDRLGYGDCKALTNYTKALMDIAGVESYYSAIYADNPKQSMEENVFSVQGNHVILNIPTEKGDLWLECTSQTVPFGHQGTFTDDRDALVITPEGGKIKHTGILDDTASFQKTIANYSLDSNGNIFGKVQINSSGIQYDSHYVLEKKSDRDIQEYYKSDYWPYLNSINIDKYSFINNKDSIIFTENINLSASDYGTFSGDRMLFVLNAFNKTSYIPKRYRSRKLPLQITRGYLDTDAFEINLPENFTIDALANDVKIENKFGLYNLSLEKISPTKLKYTRTLLIKKGTYPKEDYSAYRNFRKQIVKYDKTKIVLMKK